MPHHSDWTLLLCFAVPMLAAVLFIVTHQVRVSRKERPHLVLETMRMLDTARALATSREDVRIYVRMIRGRADRLGGKLLKEIGTTDEELDQLCKSGDRSLQTCLAVEPAAPTVTTANDGAADVNPEPAGK